MPTRPVIALLAATLVASPMWARGGAANAQANPPAVKAEDRVSAGGVLPAANALSAPRPANLNPDAGANLFGAMNCDGCHGGGAAGWVGPNLADGRWRFGGADGAIFQSIYYGRPHGMPAYGGLLLSADAVWKLVTYLESLTPPADVPTEAWDSTRP